MQSYRDTLVLLLQFTARDTRRGIERLQIADLNAERIKRFLNFLEVERHNSIATRNARLAAIHVFARYLVNGQPECLNTLQSVIEIEFKRSGQIAPIEYLETDEIDALLRSIDRSRPDGQRDYALFALMFNTGARVQEVLDLRRSDLRLDPPCQVRLRGKGNKVRQCPIWPATAQVLNEYLDRRPVCAGQSGRHPALQQCTRPTADTLWSSLSPAEITLLPAATPRPRCTTNAFTRIRSGTRPPSVCSNPASTSPRSVNGLGMPT